MEGVYVRQTKSLPTRIMLRSLPLLFIASNTLGAIKK